MAAVIVELELASNDHDESKEAARHDGEPVKLPSEPPLVDVVVGRHEEGFPRSCDENLLEEDF